MLDVRDKLLELISTGESEVLEFKESFGDKALEAISAFANSRGGTLLIGVKDSGEICGIQIGRKMLEDIANRIRGYRSTSSAFSLYPRSWKEKCDCCQGSCWNWRAY